MTMRNGLLPVYLPVLFLIVDDAADAFFLHHGHGIVAAAIGVAISIVMTARAVNRAGA